MWELPELTSSFGQLIHTAPYPDIAAHLSPLDSLSPDVDAEAEPAPAYAAAAPYPSASPSSSTSSLSPQSSWDSAHSPPAHSRPIDTAGSAQSGSRRRRRHAQDAVKQQEADTTEADDRQDDSEPESNDIARRLKHRKIDANRRAREHAVINRLQQLTERLTHIPHFDQQHATPTKRRRSAAEAKKDKVSVLEDAADRMEALYELIEQLGQECLSRYDQSRAQAYRPKPCPLPEGDNMDAYSLSLLPTRPTRTKHSLPPGSSSCRYMSDSAADHSSPPTDRSSLYSVFFLSSSLPMMTIRCDTGQVMDINSQALSLSGWARQQLIGKRITAPYSFIMNRTCNTQAEIAAVEDELSCLGHSRVQITAQDGRLVHQKVFAQYETSNALERRLYAGELSVIQAVWRLQFNEGQLHELTATQWCDQWVDAPDGEGGTRRQPTYAMYVISPESIMRVE